MDDLEKGIPPCLCGGTHPELVRDPLGYCVTCRDCGFSGGGRETKRLAMMAYGSAILATALLRKLREDRLTPDLVKAIHEVWFPCDLELFPQSYGLEEGK
jgi:hypothetical protein